MPMPISAPPAIRNKTPLSVTVTIVATREKASAAKPSTTRRTPKAVIAAHFPRKRSPASPRLCAAVPAFDAFDIAFLQGARKRTGLTGAFELAEHLRRIFDHRHDAAVIEPGRPDDAEHAGDAMVAVPERRGDHRRSGKREQLVLRTNEDLDALAGFGPVQEQHHVGLGLHVSEQRTNALKVVRGAHVAEEVRLPANDQLVARSASAGPRDEAGVDEARGDVV